MTGATLLLRQVHPSFVQAGRVTSQAFRPMPKDQSLLSVYDGERIAAEASWIHYTTELKYASVGTMAVTVDECAAESLPARSDPDPFPELAVIDFSGLTDAQCEKKSKKLKAKAESRGWLYPLSATP
jgi:hypothetical protein